MTLDFLKDPPPAGKPEFWEYDEGRMLAWNEYGDPAGEPVFYYHGWPSSRLQARFAHHLARERGLRLISMDRPGMGKSSLVKGRQLTDWPPLMERFADHLGVGKFGQMGVSGGGPYVLACAAAIPERLTCSVVLAGMVPLPLTKHGTAGLHPIYRLLIPLRKGPALVFTGMFRFAAGMTGGNPRKFPMSGLVGSLAAEDRRILLSDDGVWEVATKSFCEGVSVKNCGAGVMADAEIYFQKPDFEPSEITHEIRYWHGGDDKNIPVSLVEELVGKMPNATLILEEELGHFSLAILRAGAAMDYLKSGAGEAES